MREDGNTQNAEEMKHEYFRRVFTTHEGKVVLSIILDDLCYFRPSTNEVERVRTDYAKLLLTYIVEGNAYEIVHALVGIQKPKKEQTYGN
jgi:hypothetical protein